jgi:hypothetical protein
VSAVATDTIGMVRDAMAEALMVLPGTQVSARLLSNPTPPCAQVTRGPVQFDQAMGGGVHRPTFTITVYVGLVSDIGAQLLLDRYLAPDGDLSVKQALEADTTLGGLVQALHVTGASGEQPYNRDQGGPVLGTDFTVEVWL